MLFAGLGDLSGVPFTLTSGTIFTLIMALLGVLPVTGVSGTLPRSEEVDRLRACPTGPKVAEERGKEGPELRSGDKLPLPALATAVIVASNKNGVDGSSR
jgi:hypothetical protein